MPAPQPVLDLITNFAEHLDAYKAGALNETQVRRDFIDPLFSHLGWDMDNKAGYAEAYRDVVHEDKVQVRTGSKDQVKAPDYGFRIGGTRKFFLEAKKPSVRIKDEVSPAYQLRRYAWSAKLPLSILTDFEEFAVYDCRVKPAPTDPASKGRILYFTFDQYAEKWDEIAAIFSKQAILKGSFDKYAATTKGKRGTAAVDDEFLATIEGWRADLARNLALRNPALSQRELNFAVQRVLDRIIFLRICEDRGIEDYQRLLKATDGKGIYPRLVQLFQQADDRYNSGLFHFQVEKGRNEAHDTLTPGLQIDDALLKKVITGLYYPDSPYEFSVLSADILGSVYEQFLGKVITLTSGHQAKVEDKPEVKKAGGVFYTPVYIVDYIVRQTIGPLVEGKTPKQIARLRILDPACGSGSFLIGAYQFMLDWYHHWYSTNDPEKHAKGKDPAIFPGKGGGWVLTTAERKRILLAHIYGVDIDSQAVEVTKLSLLLKVLEGETAQTVQRELIQQRVLPDLGDNIKCGNSLIAPDFYAQPDLPDMDMEAQLRINVFDWHGKDGFPAIMKDGGFDAVIGNPPYVRIQTLKETAPEEVEFLKRSYRSTQQGNYDLYVAFVEKGLSLLCSSGLLGFILPHKFFNAEYGCPLRELIGGGKHLRQIVHFGDQQIFAGATTYTCLLFLSSSPSQTLKFRKVSNLTEWRLCGASEDGVIKAREASASEWNFSVGKSGELFEKLNKIGDRLGKIAHFFVGLQTSADTVFLFKTLLSSQHGVSTVFSKELDLNVEIETALLKPVIRSGSIGRYCATPTAWVLFPYTAAEESATLIPEAVMKRDFPRAWNYLKQNEKLLSEREHGKFKASGWWQLYPKNLNLWEQPKIMIPYMVTRLSAYFDDGGHYFVNVTTGGFGMTLNACFESMSYFTALLNSRLLNWHFKRVSTNLNSGYFAANKQFLVQLPIRRIDPKNKADVAAHDRIVALVEKRLALPEQLRGAKTPQERTVLERQIETVDAQIDKEVYALYGLTAEEIELVEGAA